MYSNPTVLSEVISDFLLNKQKKKKGELYCIYQEVKNRYKGTYNGAANKRQVRTLAHHSDTSRCSVSL